MAGSLAVLTNKGCEALRDRGGVRRVSLFWFSGSAFLLLTLVSCLISDTPPTLHEVDLARIDGFEGLYRLPENPNAKEPKTEYIQVEARPANRYVVTTWEVLNDGTKRNESRYDGGFIPLGATKSGEVVFLGALTVRKDNGEPGTTYYVELGQDGGQFSYGLLNFGGSGKARGALAKGAAARRGLELTSIMEEAEMATFTLKGTLTSTTLRELFTDPDFRRDLQGHFQPLLAQGPGGGQGTASRGTSSGVVSPGVPVPNQPTPSSTEQTPSLEETATSLVAQGKIFLSGGITCHRYDAQGHARNAFAGSDGEALLTVAREQEIFVFVHGFHPKTFGGRPTEAEVHETWAGHLELLKVSRRTFAACLFQFDTLQGYGDHQPELGNFLFALRWLTDDPRLSDPARRITLVAHSAGGNYVKHGLLLFQRHLEANGLSAIGRAATPMRLLFLGTPHQGTNLTLMAEAGVALLGLFQDFFKTQPRSYDDYASQRWQERVKGEYQHMVSSPGATQLQPGNAELRNLNALFLRGMTDNVQALNVFGTADRIVPPMSARFGSGMVELPLPNVGHHDFLRIQGERDLVLVLADFYKVTQQGFYEAWAQEQGIRSEPGANAEKNRVVSTSMALPQFAGIQQPKSQAVSACDRYLRSRLINVQDAKDQDIEDICVCAIRKFEASNLPENYKSSVFGPNGQMVLWRIRHIVLGDLPPSDVKAAADHLKDEIDRCFIPSVLLHGVWSEVEFGLEKARREYVPNSSKLNRPVYRGKGGLMTEEVSAAYQTVYTIYATRGDGNFRESPAAYSEQVSNMGEEKILVCKYRATENGRIVRYEFYWFQKVPEAFSPEFRRSLPTEHPLFLVGEPRSSCPDHIAIP